MPKKKNHKFDNSEELEFLNNLNDKIDYDSNTSTESDSGDSDDCDADDDCSPDDNEVNIVANDPAAVEGTDDNGQFTVSLSEAAETDTIISYSVGGDAVGGSDYDTLLGNVTIPAGDTSAVIDVTTIDDLILEDDETVTVTLDNITSGDANVIIGENNSDVVTIYDNDSAELNVVANDPTAVEGTDDNGQFTVTLSQASDTDTVICYSIGGDAIGGSDYDLLTGEVTILAGENSATIDVTTIDDDILESAENVTVTLTEVKNTDADITIGPNNSDEVTISDNDAAKVNIEANDPTAVEGTDDNGQFTVTLSQASDTDTVICYSIGGDAIGGSDYDLLTGEVTILAGENSATIDVTTIDDDILESAENVTVTLTEVKNTDADITIGPNNSDEVTISDNDAAKVNIEANDPTAVEGTDDNGQFTVTLSQASDTDTVICYSIGGDAIGGSDYDLLTGEVTILAGENSATIDVTTIDDDILESAENVTVTLTEVKNTDADITIGPNNSDEVTISDNDAAKVNIEANDPAAVEGTDDNGQFTVTLSQASDTDTVICYSIGGDAIGGSDYDLLTGEVTILAGENSATIDVTTIDDDILESAENVTVTLTEVKNTDADITIGPNNSDEVTISDNDAAEVNIEANDPAAVEGTGDEGQFTVTLSNVSDTDTVISYSIGGDAIGGSDYDTLSGEVSIPAGETSATIDVTTIDDLILEDDETVIVTLEEVTSGDADISIGANDSDTVIISDNDNAEVNIVANDPAAVEGTGDEGQFTVTLSKIADTDTVISYNVGGDAIGGSDYDTLTGNVTIKAGESSAIIDVTTIDDLILEDNETVTATLDSITSGDANIDIGANDSDTVVISDNDNAEVNIVANDPAAVEGTGDEGQFTVTLSNVSDTDTVVSYSIGGDAIGGSDYDTLSGEVSIPAGETSATIDVTTIDDLILEDDETVVVTLEEVTSGDADISIGANDSDTVIISDNDNAEVNIVANDPAAVEGTGDEGQFTVTLSNVSDTDTVVSYSIGGDAIGGSDYDTLSGEVSIPAGETSATIDVTTIDDLILEDDETVVVTLEEVTSGDADISIGANDSDTVIISDNDNAEVNIVANDPAAVEGTGDEGQFTVTLSNVSDTDTVISYSIGGDAIGGSDYDTLSGEVSIPAGETSATIDVTTIDDLILEEDETVIVTLEEVTSGDADISIGANDSDTVIISDNDNAEVNIVANDPAAVEGTGDEGQFTVTLSKIADTDTVISYNVGGDAIGGSDYDTLSGSVTILSGESSAIIDVTTIDDFILEDNETVTATLDSITSGDANIDIGANDSDTVVISDNDIAEVNIVANDPIAIEGTGDEGQFTVSLSQVSDTDTVISYNVGGDAVGGSDYDTLTGNVTIKAGESSAIIDVNTIDDDILENPETVTVTLDEITSGDANIDIGANDSDTVTINDNDFITNTEGCLVAGGGNVSGAQIVGTVNVDYIGEGELNITYQITPDGDSNTLNDWMITDTHLDIGYVDEQGQFQEISLNKKGTPSPGQFDAEYDSLDISDSTVVYNGVDIPDLPDGYSYDDLIIAAHAVVEQSGGGSSETAWAAYKSFDDEGNLIDFTQQFSSKKWASYLEIGEELGDSIEFDMENADNLLGLTDNSVTTDDLSDSGTDGVDFDGLDNTIWT